MGLTWRTRRGSIGTSWSWKYPGLTPQLPSPTGLAGSWPGHPHRSVLGYGAAGRRCEDCSLFQEWSIRQFLYNLTDQAALKVVGQVISQRCLETGVSEVHLEVSQEDREKEKMIKFIDVIESSGLSLREANVYMPTNPHISNHRNIQRKRVQPWTVLEPEN